LEGTGITRLSVGASSPSTHHRRLQKLHVSKHSARQPRWPIRGGLSRTSFPQWLNLQSPATRSGQILPEPLWRNWRAWRSHCLRDRVPVDARKLAIQQREPDHGAREVDSLRSVPHCVSSLPSTSPRCKYHTSGRTTSKGAGHCQSRISPA